MSGASRSRNSRGVSERASENATTQIGPEVALDPCGDTAPQGVRLCRLREESLEVLLDQRVERRLSGTAPAVDGPTVWCGGPKGGPWCQDHATVRR